jgi:hypothetical protein
MAIIVWSEVARSAETEEERIRAKDAIYRGLIQEQARLEGRPFEKVLVETIERNERIEAEPETKEAIEIVAQREGLSIYETKLDGRIEIKEIWISGLKGKVHPVLKLI